MGGGGRQGQRHTGEFHDQRDAKWIIIRGQLRGHNDTADRLPGG
jgi:hypothetical protein